LKYGRSDKQINSIAVMPFVNESGNADVEYLSDGMTEILIGSLSQLPNLNVKARTSVFRYKGKEVDPRSVANDLNVQAILTGRVLQHANNLTLYVELIDTATENVLWKADYQRQMTDLVVLQKEIAEDVSQKLRSKLTPAETKRLAKGSNTTNAEAYRLYLQGRYFWSKRKVPEMGKAIGYFQQAIDLDPNYALAYAGLSDAIAQPNALVPYLERRDKAKAAVDKALALDPELAEAHSSLAHILLRYDLDFAGAERELKRALELDPRWIDIYQRLGELYAFQGRPEESISWMRKGLELEPFNVPLNAGYGASLYLMRQYDAALAQLQKTFEMDPNHRPTQLLFFNVYAAKGMHPEAVEHRLLELKISGEDLWADRLRESFATKGWHAFLREDLKRFYELRDSPYLQPVYAEAGTYALLGEKEKAFDALERSIERRERPSLATLKVDPRFDILRDDPRFAELLKKAGFREL
jgi:TolB-like protein